MPARKPSKLGVHVPVGTGLARGAVPYARAIGAEALQVFSSNPRGWAPAPGDRAQDAAFRAGCAQAGLTLSLIHISEPTRLLSISYAVFCLKKKNAKQQ